MNLYTIHLQPFLSLYHQIEREQHVPKHTVLKEHHLFEELNSQ